MAWQAYEAENASPSDPYTLYSKKAQDAMMMPVKKPGIVGASFNLVNFVAGTGILGLPLAFAQTGWAVSLVLLIIMAVISAYTMDLMGRLSERLQVFNTVQLAEKSFGKGGAIFLLILIMVNSFGFMCIYLIAITGQLTPFFAVLFGLDPEAPSSVGLRAFILIVVLCFVTPLSMKKDMADLMWAGVVGIAILIFLCAVVLFYYVRTEGMQSSIPSLSA
jgi:amino acid permease